MATFAAEDSMIAVDAEYQATLESMSQRRKIASDSLYEELKRSAEGGLFKKNTWLGFLLGMLSPEK